VQIRALLADHIENYNLCPGAKTVEEWLSKGWVAFDIGGRSIPLIPLWGLKKALIAHDVHHVLTGYETSFEGECALAGWELSSGGCRWNLAFWADRIAFFALGLVTYPVASLRALRRGWGARNLYGMRSVEILESDAESLHECMRL